MATHSKPMKVVFITTQYVETDPMSFKSVVQGLTGKDAVVGAAATAPRNGRSVTAAEGNRPPGVGGCCGGSRTLGLSRDWSFNGLLSMELPTLEELNGLWAD